MESHILHYSEIVASVHAISPKRIQPNKIFDSWETMKHTLKALGYDPQNDPGWTTFGISPDEQDPQKGDSLELRYQFARLIIQGAPTSAWKGSDTTSLHTFISKLDLARQICLTEPTAPLVLTPHTRNTPIGENGKKPA